MAIHPTAMVHPDAKLAGDIEVGPWAIIGPGVELGPRCVVHARATIEGAVVAGADNVFGIGAIIGAPPQDFAFDPSWTTSVRIGSGNNFREYVTIHRGTKEGTATVVGDNCFLMAGAHLGHNAQLGSKAILANNVLLAGYVEIGDGAVIGGGTVFRQFTRVGHFAMIGGGARFNKDIPPYCLADTENTVTGINAIGLRRAGFPPAVREEIRRAFKLICRSDLGVRQALDAARASVWGAEATSFLDFVAASKRGICIARKGGASVGADPESLSG